MLQRDQKISGWTEHGQGRRCIGRKCLGHAVGKCISLGERFRDGGTRRGWTDGEQGAERDRLKALKAGVSG